MTKLLRPLAAAAAALGVATAAAVAVSPPDPPAAAKPAEVKEGLKYAVDPKPLSDAVKKGLKWLADRQNEDGGWSQGGGWRTGGQGRVEGKEVADPSDVGNTCIALMAFIRAGNTPAEGEYKEHVKKGLKFVCGEVGKAKADDLYVTDVRNTQLQSKIGPYADTFFTALVLAELKGKAGQQEKDLVAALDKTISKMAKNQKDDGTFAGNGGWAPVLSQGVANNALARARMNGANVPDQVFARATRQSRESVNGTAVATAPAAGTTVASATPAGKPAAGGISGPAPAGAFEGSGRAGFGGGGLGAGGGRGDAGVPLYGFSQGAGNIQGVANAFNGEAEKNRKVIADPKATKEAKDQAQKQLDETEKVNKEAQKAVREVAGQARDGRFVAGFGSNGGEEFLSFLNISEAMCIKGGKDWTDWDGKMQEMLPKAQDKDGSWSGHHCITGKTFCTSAALLVMLADRTQFPAEVIKAAREEKKDEPKPEEKKPEEKK